MKLMWKIIEVVAVLLVVASGLIYLDSAQQSNAGPTAGQSEADVQNAIQTEVGAEAQNAVQIENTTEPSQVEEPRVGGNIGLTSLDFPGYSSLGLVSRTIEDVPAEARENFASWGFEYSVETRLQKPLLGGDEVPDNNFRELQSTVFIFSTASGASGFMDNLVQNFNKTFELVNMEVGEKGVAYIDTFPSEELNVEVEQQFLYFIEKNAIGTVSVTGLETANMTVDLLLEAARKLVEKMR